MNRNDIDRLGDRLRRDVTAEDLTLLDTYRRELRASYETVINRIRKELNLEISGRPRQIHECDR